TQNPAEHHGTYPLPESQLDRFLMRVRMGYPSFDEEKEILRQQTHHHPLEQITPVMNGDDVLDLQEEIKNVRVDDVLIDYLIDLVAVTRHSQNLELGGSPRRALAPLAPAPGLCLPAYPAHTVPVNL